jgi:hypothetical protein
MRNNIRLLILLAGWLLVGCEVLEPTPPTLTPTYEYSAPTLESTPRPDIHPPTFDGDGSEENASVVNPGQNIPQAAGLPPQSDLPPVALEPEAVGAAQLVRLALREGEVIEGLLYEDWSPLVEEEDVASLSPGVLLLGAPAQIWGDFPARLHEAGYTVLLMELDDSATREDFGAVLRALSNSSSVNPSLIGVIAVGQGSGLALIGCAAEPLCDAAALISPEPDDRMLPALPAYHPRPLLLAAGTQDAGVYEMAQSLEEAAQGEVLVQMVETAVHGVELLATQPGLIETLIDWLAAALAE